MVYCGKLSKACLPCRKRKLACDLRKDGCSQCSRARLTCSGYRDTEALRIRDESSAVQRKAQACKSAKAIPSSLTVSTRTQAQDLFYYNFVVGSSKSLEFYQDYFSPTSKDELLVRSLDAVALAYFNYQRHSPIAKDEARYHYTKALSLTKATIQHPDLVKKDSTILAILLLDLYEKITTRENNFEGAWAAHLCGALSLVRFRGDQQFNNPKTLLLLRRLSTNLLISCVASHRPVSPELIDLRSSIAARFSKPCDPKWRESDLMIEFTRIRLNINGGVLSGEDAISSLVQLDRKFSRLAAEVPPTWGYKTIRVNEKSDHHYEMYHHLHTAESSAQMWNTLWLTRILLNELVASLCLDSEGAVKRDPRALAIHQDATETIKNMASNICASVPQYIRGPFRSSSGPVENRDFHPANGNARISFDQYSNPTQHLPCYRLIYPLYVAAQAVAAPPLVKPWVTKQLLFMAEYHAIENAAKVAKILESGEKRDVWCVYALLGSYAFVC